MAQTTYYISEQTGDDSNSGTSTSPFRTIQKGADVAQAGDTVYVLEGVYRERVAPPRGGTSGSPIVYMAEPGKDVYIKGSNVWSPTWNNLSGTVYSASPPDSMFNDDVYLDNKNPFLVPVSSTPYGLNGQPETAYPQISDPELDPNLVLTIGQVFVDGFLLTQKGYLHEVQSTVNSWYVDRSNPANIIIYINFPDNNPDNHEVEISTRRRIFAPHTRRLEYIVVDGFIMEHCGNQYPTNFWNTPVNAQAGALGTRSGKYWTIKNNTIRYAHGIGIDFGNECNPGLDLEVGNNGSNTGARGHIIDSNYITNNGSGGTAAYFPRDITFTNNVVQHNNNLMFDGWKRWETAGVKMHGPNYSVMANNLIRDNYVCPGIWLDQGSGDSTRVSSNLIIGNEIGFDLEIGDAFVDKLIVDNNVFVDNEDGIKSRESGGITTLNNLFVNSTKNGIYNRSNKNRAGSWSSDNHHHFNNIFIGNQNSIVVNEPSATHRSLDRQFDYNVYDATSSETKFAIYEGSNSSPQNFDFADWKSEWNTYNSGANYDVNATITQDLSYTFDPSTFELNVDVSFDITTLDILQHNSLDVDYEGGTIPNNSTAIPGPFQNLVQGNNQFDLWGDVLYEIIDSLSQPKSRVALDVTDDAFVRGGTFANDKFGTDTQLIAKDLPSDLSFTREVYVKFDLSGIPSNANSIKFKINSANSTGGRWGAYLVTDDNWNEENITWNTKPAQSTYIGSQLSSGPQVLEWDVTTLVQAETDQEITIKIVDEMKTDFSAFYSKEGAPSDTERPRLIYEVPAAVGNIEDAFVQGGTNANSNYGDNDNFVVKEASGVESDRKGFLRFNLSNISGNFQTAKIRLKVRDIDASSSSHSVRFVSDDSWLEGGITWNNQPSFGSIHDTETVTSIGQWVEFDVLSLANTELAGDGILSVALTSADDTFVRYHSSEAVNTADRPEFYYETENIASNDAFVRSGTFANDNYGNDDSMVVKEDTGTNFSRRSYLKFDLSNVVSDDFQTAKVMLKVRDITGTSSHSIHFVSDDSWLEGDITWNNQPSFGSIDDTETVTSIGQWVEFDVLSLVNTELGGDGVLSVVITSTDASFVRYHSSEAANAGDRPRIVLESSINNTSKSKNKKVLNTENVITKNNNGLIMTYPNPTRDGRFTLQVSDDNYTHWEFYDLAGRLLDKGDIISEETKIQINHHRGLGILIMKGFNVKTNAVKLLIE